jgi:hypothetical protein
VLLADVGPGQRTFDELGRPIEIAGGPGELGFHHGQREQELSGRGTA